MNRLLTLLTLPLLLWSALLGSAAPAPAPQQAPAPPADIRTSQLHVILVAAGNTVRVAEYHVLSNTGTETYLGTEVDGGVRRTLGFQLPEGATNLRFDGPGLGERFVEEPGGFFDTEPIPPGEASVTVTYSYDLPLRRGMTIVRQSEVPVDSVVAIVTGTGLGLEGPNVVYRGTMETQMGPAAQYTAGSLEPGQELRLSVVEVPVAEPAPTPAQASTPGRNSGLEWGIGLASLALGAAVAYVLWRPGGSSRAPEAVRGLVGELASLEEAMEREALSRAEYQRRRAALVRRIRSRLAGERKA